ncbi:replicative DNA helicase [Pedobacter sp. N36a]|uniref:replicative DNA helicase n=1 Tax=Pedobacter sp. N36a TaxID=2767996 RepID=UPI001656B254|nr:replicative DNA helicase [Pedobacter sp. N36a]MBC8984778.1 replicative DNA helicase [Pedobacter sp. N36a]
MRNKLEILNVPPQAKEFEEAVLGAVMLEREAYHEISSLINENSFYDERHKKIFKAIKSLFMASSPIDIITVVGQLRRLGDLEAVGGAFYVTELTSRVASSANIAYHAGIIMQKYLERETIRIVTETSKNIFKGDQDIFMLQDQMINSIQKLTETSAGQISELSDIVKDRLLHYETKSENGLTGIPSGFHSIDLITSGWQNSNLVILAGRPGMGKTAFMLNLCRNAAVIGNQPTVIFSLEMSKEQLTDRMLSAETGIPLDKILNRNLQPWEFYKFHHSRELIESTIFIDDTASLSIQSFRSKCARLKRNHNIGLIVVDYLQLMKGESEYKNNREQEISSISRSLKAVAKDLNVPVIALSQLSRKVEERAGAHKRPMLSDLRESGSIEQDADQVIFLFRPEYYGIMEDAEGNSMVGITEVNFAKNRNGAIDTAILSFNGAKMKFSEIQGIPGEITNETNEEKIF